MIVYAVYWTSFQIDTVKTLWATREAAEAELDSMKKVNMKGFVREMRVWE